MKKLLALLPIVLAVPAQAVLVTFDNTSDFALFTPGVITTGDQWAYSTADGVGTPDGAVRNAGGAEQLNYTAGSFNLVGGTWTVSADFVGVALTTQNSTSSLSGIGFLTEASMDFRDQEPNRTIFARINNNGEAGTFRLQLFSRATNNASGANQLVQSGTFNLANGDWYRLSLSLTPVGGSDFSYSVAIESRGPDGVSAGTPVVTTLTGTLSNAAIAGDSTVFAGYLGKGDFVAGGTQPTFMDNFEVVPEPGSAALLGVAALGLLLRRRRG